MLPIKDPSHWGLVLPPAMLCEAATVAATTGRASLALTLSLVRTAGAQQRGEWGAPFGGRHVDM